MLASATSLTLLPLLALGYLLTATTYVGVLWATQPPRREELPLVFAAACGAAAWPLIVLMALVSTVLLLVRLAWRSLVGAAS